MPKIEISEKLFYSLLGKTPSFKELEEMLICAKAEIDEAADEDGNLKIELNDTNRPDLWTLAGLARHVRTYYNLDGSKHNATKFDFSSKNSEKEKKIIVDKALKSTRPYVLGFIASGKKINEELLKELIQIQEKLCENFGQKRKTIAIGIYRENQIKWPVHYVAADPQKESFVPLDFTESLSLSKILSTHPKGKEYGHLISSFANYPLLKDSANNVLSMPPIINSSFIGAVQEGDTDVFIECTGDNLEQLMLAANILACDCQELGFSITRIHTQFPYDIGEFAAHAQKENNTFMLSAPLHFQEPASASLEDIHAMLGETLSTQEICNSLEKMNLIAHYHKDTKSIEIEVPLYRNDFLHSVDVIEDIIIGKGLNNLEPQYPQSFTIGKVTDIELMSRKVISSMVGLGFQEMIFPYLGSRVDFVERMYDKKDWDSVAAQMVQISNPISENYEFIRSSILPNLLAVERVSAHSPYPHKICELGKVACIDDSENLGSRTDTTLGFLMANPEIGFTDIHAVISAVLYYLYINWTIESIVDSRFIEGRVCKILVEDTHINRKIPIGIFGEIHPRVLEAYNITMPCVGGEIAINNIAVI